MKVLERNNIWDNSKCCIIFPSAYSKFFRRIVPSFLGRELDLDYSFFVYEHIDKKAAESIRNSCQGSCILIIAYKGKIALEHSYKLGIAHAFNACVILIDLQKEDCYSLPEYVKYNFMIYGVSLKQKQGIENLLQKIREVIAISLSGDTIEILYEEAKSICAALEERHSIDIAKVNKKIFTQRLSNEDISLCFNDYEASREILLEKIILDEISLALVYLGDGASISEIEETSQMNNGDKYTWIGDRVAGDKFTGDKVMGNKVQIGTVQGDAVAGNKIVNAQDLTQAAQDIKALLDQLAIDYPQDDDFTRAGRAVGGIKNNPNLKQRLINAARESSFTAVEKAIEAVVENPAVGIIVAGVKGFIDAEG
jgi:hypothetical protein